MAARSSSSSVSVVVGDRLHDDVAVESHAAVRYAREVVDANDRAMGAIECR